VPHRQLAERPERRRISVVVGEQHRYLDVRIAFLDVQGVTEDHTDAARKL
jgi:hypothetical protein